MRRPPSLTLRLTLLFGAVAVVVFTGFGWFIERSIERHFDVEDDAELEIIARTVSEVLTGPDAVNDPETLRQRLNDIAVWHHGAVLYITGRNGGVFFTSPGASGFSAIAENDVQRDAFYRWRDDNHTYRVLTRRLDDDGGSGGYTMSIAIVIDHHLRFLVGFRRTLWVMIASGIVIMGLMGWFAVRQGHGPLRDIVARIRRISASELNTRLSPETVPRELTDLAVSFNEMMARMEDAFQKLSNFSADIAHELRTPVTNLLTQTQVALSQSRDVDEYREILYSNIEEYERMAQMIGDMLFLAKADNGLYELNTVDVNLAREVQGLFEYYEAWAEERGVSLAVEGSATVAADKLMLRRVLGNLLSNAIRHTPAGNTVTVRLDQTMNDGVAISVENPGPAIADEHIPRLFDRFYRVDASRQRAGDGAGLGLAIAKSIVDLHGGNIDATSEGENTRFRITLPVSPKPA